MIDVSCVVTAHREGLILYRTLVSIRAALKLASSRGLSCEVVIVLDKADDATSDVSRAFDFDGHSAHIVRSEAGDPAAARSFGIGNSVGRSIAIVDGDDLVSENWISRAEERIGDDRSFVIHPEMNIVFDQQALFYYHPDQSRDDFDASALLVENYWTALAYADRSVYDRVPYQTTSDGFGYEDWLWNCDTIAAGFKHVVAPGTIHFIRSKRIGSRNALARTENLLIPRSSLLDKRNFWA